MSGHTPGDGGPAFASAGLDWHQDGMSLRDYFAAQALSGVIGYIAKLSPLPKDIDKAKLIARLAYETSDAMLAARASP